MHLQLGLVRDFPTVQTELDIFKGHWTYRLPLEGSISGDAGGFDSERQFLLRCEDHFGRFDEFSVLELGPLEGEVTYSLHKMGAREIVSIEGRQSSYLKCLIVKNALGLDRVRFMLGDFSKYLGGTEAHFDFCCAQGILYHMTDPVEILRNIARLSDRCYIGTHYFDAERLLDVSGRGEYVSGIANPRWNISALASERETRHSSHGFDCTYYRHAYNVTREQQEDPDRHHHHGLDLHAYFMRKEDIVSCLEHFGMIVLEVIDEPDAERGPYCGIIACRSGVKASANWKRLLCSLYRRIPGRLWSYLRRFW